MNTKIKSGQIKITITDLPLIDSSLDGVMRFRGFYTQTTFPNVSNPRKGDLIIWYNGTTLSIYIYDGTQWIQGSGMNL
jgi:hypothetical protein